ncbi:hypothetical protein JVT61DRAFT_12840 [Boletus reticuloceps]|uniref:C2H2-type domain-containing protein n=1 Tax=Boletus reticuloceps TaxID=495285 RepID=A0A8I3ADK8_9AGAM|nr:hypothetical protein JVT61DRAFT_12840 [Boletus reticuloceps]
MSDNDAASDQRQKESSVSLAASSMINASDSISEESYQANLKRIQEVREMVRRLEMNNEVAHKNYLVDQLEKRANDGREAEIMLARLRNQPRHSETAQFTNNVSSAKSEIILPSTATLVEVPESHPSHPSPAPATISLSQTTQQARFAEYPPQVQPYNPYNPNHFRYYMGPPTVRQPPQHSSTSRPQVMDGQMYTTQSVPSQSRLQNPLVHQSGFQPVQVQQHSPLWSNYPPPVTAMQVMDTAPVPGYYPSSSGWIRTEPAYSAPSTGSSSTTCCDSGFRMQSTAPRFPVTTHNQSQNLTPPASTFQVQVQVPLHGAPAPSAKIPSGQPSSRSQLTPAETHSRPVPTVVPKEIAISEHQRHHIPPQQPQHHRQQSVLQPQQLPQLPPQPQQYPQPHQPPPQRLLQPRLQPEQHAQQPQEVSSQRPLQPPQTHQQAPPRSAGRTAASVSQLHSQPSQGRDSTTVNASPGISQTRSPHPTIVQERARQRDAQPRADQATFTRLFQAAVQRGILPFKNFLLQAKASGISDEWLRAAIHSLPRNVWESIAAQLSQPGPTPDAQSSANVSQQQVSAIVDPSVPAVSIQSSSTATPFVQTTPATHQAANPDISAEERITPSAARQTSGSYATQLKYYAEQATKSALSAQAASISTTPPGNIPLGQEMVATPTRGVPQAQDNERTPKDANKSTLARDILRSLGKIVPKPFQEMGSESAVNDHGGDQLPAVNFTQLVSHIASPKPPLVSPATSFARTNSPSIPSAKPNVQEHVTTPGMSTTNSVLNEKYGQAAVIEGPIMIDLTLDDSDESVDGERQEPEATFPIQTSATTATSSKLVSPTNTTNHTPLLENLSLEEPPVDVAPAGDNADVRMYSPVLSLAAEENMEPELSYPPPGSTEPVSPSFETLPHEASEHPLDGQLPLFLPSPPVSPAHTEPPETDFEMISDDGKIRPSLKRRSVGADGKETDTDVLAPRIGKRRKQQVYVLVPPAPPYVKKAIRKMRERAMGKDADSDSEGVGEDEEFQYSHPEQLLIEESKSRLLERPCRWLNCGAVLNCAVNLLAHLKKHAREGDWQAPFLCRWAGCEREFDVKQERDVHLEKHTIRPLPCPFAGENTKKHWKRLSPLTSGF